MSRLKAKGRGNKQRYAGIPHAVMDTDDYKGLHGNAVKLLLALTYQYRFNNNGDLTAAFSVMQKKFGFKSKETLASALSALLEANLIIKTREGMFLNPGGKCALYALSWQPIDECKGKRLEVKPTAQPPRKFSVERNK